MAGFQTNIATKQANTSMPTNPFSPPSQAAPSKYASSLDPNKPWEYDYMGQSSGFSPSANGRLGQNNGTGSEYVVPGGNFGGGVMANGPKGYGYYQFHSPGQNAVGAQQHYTEEFKNNMPHLNDLLTSKLGQDVNQGLGQSIHAQRIKATRMGSAFGGYEQGQEGLLHANAAGQMAQGKSDINSGLQSSLEGMQSGTVKAGVNWQQQQQSMQNAIYQQALANMAAQNKAFSSVGSAAGMAAGMYFGSAAGPAGTMAGGQLGAQMGGSL